MTLVCLALVVVLLCAQSIRVAPVGVEPTPTGRILRLDDQRLRVEFVTDRIVRVTATREGDWSRTPSLMRVEVDEQPGAIGFSERDDLVEIRSSKLIVRVDRLGGDVSFVHADGRPLLAEKRGSPRSFERVAVIKSVPDPSSIRKVKTVDGEREVADRYVQARDRDAWQAAVRFDLSDDESLYGLGFDETDDLNLRGRAKRLYQHNLRVVIPTLVSTRGYGLLFDAYSAMTFADDRSGCSMSFDVVEQLDYYFILGPDMDGVIAGYRQLTGAAAMPPRWGFGYVQSKERYKTQQELVATAREFRQRRIPLDVIVQDWQYWPTGYWGALELNREAYPDPSSMTRALHEMNVRLMLSIWPNPDRKSASGVALREAGCTLAGTPYVDFLNPAARDLYWKLVWENLGKYGIDAWWCDSTEPVVEDWRDSRPEDVDATNIDGLAKVIDAQWLSAYALESSRGIHENWRKTVPGRRVLNLTRSGYAGSQRFGAVVWSGDVTAKWSSLAQQIPSVLNFSAAGDPWWTTDIGAFFVKRGKQWFWNGDYQHGADDLGYRELYARWMQFAVFLPMFRSHGTDTPREPWHFGEPGTPFRDAILQAIHLRYRLLPFLYSLAGAVHHRHASFIRPVAFAFPGDMNARDLKTQMLVGDELLVCPVVSAMYFDVGSKPLDNVPKQRDVYLPAGACWIDFWTGTPETGGRTIDTASPLDHIPVFVRAGSIVPLGPLQQYTDEKPDAPLEIRVYPGADGTYTFYEDAGDGYGYERGEFATTRLSWDDSTRTLHVAARKGRFDGMLPRQTARVVLVSPGRGVGILEDARHDAEIVLDGTAQTINLASAGR